MKNSTRSASDSDWENLLSRARSDAPPPIDLTAVLRAVREAPYSSRSDWFGEFLGLFSSLRAVSACVAGIGLFAVFATWQVWSVLPSLPWAQLIDTTTGGVP